MAVTPADKPKYTCVQKVWQGYHYARCGKDAKENGFCRWHNPETVAKKKAAVEKRQKERAESNKAHYELQNQRQKNADAFPDLLKALEDIEMETRSGGQFTIEEINELARAAIQKAKGL